MDLHENILQAKVYIIRGFKVMFDEDLAELYETETRLFNRAVKRNITRFPQDFMFQLSKSETDALRSQFGISKKGKGGRRYIPFVFTEQGIAMLSSVLKSERAIAVNIQIMRMFARLREALSTHKELKEKIEQLERKYDGQFDMLFEKIDEMIAEKNFEDETPKEKIGFRTE